MRCLYPNIPSPCYVLEEELLLRNLKIMRRVQEQSGAQIICALKGFAMFSVFPLCRQYLSGCTASSLHEARLSVEEWGKKAHLCAPAYVPSEIDALLGMASHITFNSLEQYRLYGEQAHAAGVSCGLRINPEYSTVETALYDPCAKGSRLGIRRKALGSLLPVGIEGLHFHTLCEQGVQPLLDTFAEVEKNFEGLLREAKWLNLGGGHLITSGDYEVDRLIDFLKYVVNEYNVTVILEPGGAIGYEAGFLKSSVLDLIDSDGIEVAVLDVSFTAHMPDCLEMPYKPEIRGAQEPRPELHNYRMGGISCLSGDQVGDYGFEQKLSIGDELFFESMIHYTMVKTTTFNGVNLPSIGILRTDGTFELVRSFGYKEFRDRLS